MYDDDRRCCICLEEISGSCWKCKRCTCHLHNSCQQRWSDYCPQCKLALNSYSSYIYAVEFKQVILAVFITIVIIKNLATLTCVEEEKEKSIFYTFQFEENMEQETGKLICSWYK